MTDPSTRNSAVPLEPGDTEGRDPDKHSTWNTLDGTVEIDDVLDEDDLEDFLVEPIPDPLDPFPTPDSPGPSR